MIASTDLNSLVWTHFIQVSLVAAIAFAVAKTIPKSKTHLAHAIWALVLLKCITPPIISSPIGAFAWINLTESSISNELEWKVETKQGLAERKSADNRFDGEESSAKPLAKQPSGLTAMSYVVASSVAKWLRQIPWFTLWLGLGTLVAVGFTIRLATFLGRIRFLRRRQTTESRRLSKNVQGIGNDLASKLGIHRTVRVLVLDSSIGPAVIGLLRPTVLLPRSIVENATRIELESLLAHELIHFRRGDLYWSIVQVAALVVSWFNPCVWYASKRLGMEAERCCDEETVASLGIAPKDYAFCLIRVLEQKQSLKAAPLLPGVRPVEVTAKRLERIMRFGQGSRSRCPVAVHASLALGAILLLPAFPVSMAQENEKTETPTAKKGIVYDLKIVDVPIESTMGLVKSWTQLGKDAPKEIPDAMSEDSSGNLVVPASFEVVEPTFSIHRSGPLSESEVDKILESGDVLSAPKVTAFDGTPARMVSGGEVPYVASFDPVKGDDGEVGAMQPQVKFILDGIQIDLLGKLKDGGNLIDLNLEYSHKAVKDMHKFTFKSSDGELTVDRPVVESHGVATDVELASETTIAICGGPYTRTTVIESKVPVLSSVPYVGRLFKNSYASSEKYSTILVVSCRVVDDIAATAEPTEGAKYQYSPAAVDSDRDSALARPVPASTVVESAMHLPILPSPKDEK